MPKSATLPQPGTKCCFTPLPPPPPEMKSWQIWEFLGELKFWTSDFSDFKVLLYPPPPPEIEKLADLLEVSSQVENLDSPPPPPPKLKSWKIWRFQVKLKIWTSDFKVPLYSHPPPPFPWKLKRWEIWKKFGLQISKCRFTPPPPRPPQKKFKRFESFKSS